MEQTSMEWWKCFAMTQSHGKDCVETCIDTRFYKIDIIVLNVIVIGGEGANLNGARRGNKDFIPSWVTLQYIMSHYKCNHSWITHLSIFNFT